MDYTVTSIPIGYEIESQPLHYTIRDTIGYTIESQPLHYRAKDTE